MRYSYGIGDSTPNSDDLIEVTFEGESLHGDPPKTRKKMFCLEKIRHRRPVLQRIKELYDGGTPFFTKEMMRAALQERERIMTEKVDMPIPQLRGLDGQVGDNDVLKLPLKFIDGEMRHSSDQDPNIPKLRIGMEYYVSTSFGALKLGIPFHGFASNMLTVRLLVEALSPPPTRPTDVVKREFEEAKALWEASDLRRHVWDKLMSTPSISQVKRAVLFATGSPTRHAFGHYATSSMQICLGITVRETALTRRREDCKEEDLTIECLAQDPEFAPSDVDILAPYDVKIVPDPEGFLALDDSTAVIVFYPDIAVRNISLDICRPPIFICDAIKKQCEKVICSLGEDEK